MSQRNYKIDLDKDEVVLLAKTVFRMTVLPNPPFPEKLLSALPTALESLQSITLEELDKHEDLVYSMSRKEVKALRELCLQRVFGLEQAIIPQYKDQPDMLSNANKLKDAYERLAAKFTV